MVLLRLRHFFEKNLTGFTYLFFAQALFIAENIFWRYQLKGAFGKTPLHSLGGVIAIFEIIFYYSFLLIFLTAAFLTFRYPKDKICRDIFVIIIVMMSLIIFTAALLS